MRNRAFLQRVTRELLVSITIVLAMAVAGEGGAVGNRWGHYGLQELHRSTRLPRLCASSLILPACAGPAPISYSFRIYFTNLFMASRPFGRCDRYIASGGTLL